MTIDKHILITGANGGIGFEVARLLAEQKANLTLLYHENQQQLENFSTPGQQLEIKKVDLANEKELNNTITSILQNHPIDIFIHSPAYPIQHRDIMNTTWNDFQKQIDLQTKSFLQISKLIILKFMMKLILVGMVEYQTLSIKFVTLLRRPLQCCQVLF